jgi:predicted benzoate:H+ symporter BenE
MDVLFPVLYGTVFFLLIRRVFNKIELSRTLTNAVSALPLLAMGFDWAENIAFVRMIYLYPDQSPNTARIANVMTLSKFSFLLAGFFGLLVGWIAAFVRRARNKGG